MQRPPRPIHHERIAECTVRAAHRRDHFHGSDPEQCHPHVVEVIHLGEQAVVVCHCCRADSGFIGHRDAERAAFQHRVRTAVVDPSTAEEVPADEPPVRTRRAARLTAYA